MLRKSTLTPPKGAEKWPSTLDPPEYGTKDHNKFMFEIPSWCSGTYSWALCVYGKLGQLWPPVQWIQERQPLQEDDRC